MLCFSPFGVQSSKFRVKRSGLHLALQAGLEAIHRARRCRHTYTARAGHPRMDSAEDLKADLGSERAAPSLKVYEVFDSRFTV